MIPGDLIFKALPSEVCKYILTFNCIRCKMSFLVKHSIVLVVVLTIVAIDVANSQDPKCLDCICKAAGCDSQIGNCVDDNGSLSCGPYQIKEPYWIDCGKPEGDYQQCTKQKACSELCVMAYMKRYGRYCTGGREPTCKDYAKIHKGGPSGCNSTNDDYWITVEKCLV